MNPPTVSSLRLHPLSLTRYSFLTFPFVFDLLQKLVNARALLFNHVAHKMKLRSMPKAQRKAKLPAHVWGRMTKGAHCRLTFLLVTGEGHVNAGIPQIV